MSITKIEQQKRDLTGRIKREFSSAWSPRAAQEVATWPDSHFTAEDVSEQLGGVMLWLLDWEDTVPSLWLLFQFLNLDGRDELPDAQSTDEQSGPNIAALDSEVFQRERQEALVSKQRLFGKLTHTQRSLVLEWLKFVRDQKPDIVESEVAGAAIANWESFVSQAGNSS